MDKEFWIIIDERPQGPFTYAQLEQMHAVTPSTMVWYDELTDWLPASEVAALSALIAQESGDAAAAADVIEGMPSVPCDDCDIPQIPDGAVPVTAYASSEPAHVVMTEAVAVRPANYLAWSIVSIFLFFPFGIVALLCSLAVNRNYKRGDMQRACLNSERAQWWIIASIVCGLVTWPLRMVIGF